MVGLLDLPTDVILAIIESRPHPKYTAARLAPVCRRLNDVCGHIIFHTYNLTFRQDHSRSYREIWDPEVVRTRLADLQRKALFVRKLRIIDYAPAPEFYRYDSEDEQDPEDELPAEIVPELLDVLKTLTSIVDVSIMGCDCHDRTRLSPFPRALWDWIASVKPRELKFMMNLSFPADLQPISGVKVFYMWAYTEETDKIVQMIHAPELRLRYPNEKNVHKFIPYDGLLDLSIDADIRNNRLTSQFFDFRRMSSTAEIRIAITFKIERMEKWDVPSMWRKYKRQLPKIFEEDLAAWDVRRDFNDVVLVKGVSYPDGEHRQDHIPDEDEEAVEERNARAARARHNARAMQRYDGYCWF
ncbi:hypothetical protein DENSPDRAFT_842282 [Dentipellis sp. KUC8613]|nr:hypothetical protein DENSPDRAFT_842282 [Dentipellis sp. KUC8613]